MYDGSGPRFAVLLFYSVQRVGPCRPIRLLLRKRPSCAALNDASSALRRMDIVKTCQRARMMTSVYREFFRCDFKVQILEYSFTPTPSSDEILS